MTELELLEDKIGEFQAHLNDAWRSLSSSSLTTFERRELRNEMKRCGAELQRCLELVQAEHSRSRMRLAENAAAHKVVDFRLLGQSGIDSLLPVLPAAIADTHHADAHHDVFARRLSLATNCAKASLT
jgi:hypothetical protein